MPKYLKSHASLIPKFWWDSEIPLCSPSLRLSFDPCLWVTGGFAGVIRKDLLRTKSPCFIDSYGDTRRTHMQFNHTDSERGNRPKRLSYRMSLSRWITLLALSRKGSMHQLTNVTHQNARALWLVPASFSPHTHGGSFLAPTIQPQPQMVDSKDSIWKPTESGLELALWLWDIWQNGKKAERG